MRNYLNPIISCWVATCLLVLLTLPATGQNYPSDFSQVRVTDGLANPTAMAFAPDGRTFVTQQAGQLRVIENGTLLNTPVLSLNVDARGERGLIGLTLDPQFASNGYVYLFYTLSDGSRNRVSRFTMQGDLIDAGSETILRNLDPLSSATNHNGGAMLFKEGKLYIAIGENANRPYSQDLDTYHGKILRINPDGSVPAGNPFTSGSLQKRSIWSWGLRNPFTFDVEPGTGRIFVNEVGQSSWEEINDATAAGRNFGWPAVEGTSSNSSYVNPEFAYPHGSGDGKGCAITGGTFFSPSTTTYPSKYRGGYFYQDYCNNWINYLDASGSRQPFATNLSGRLLGLTTGPDGNLYYLNRSNSSLYRIIHTRNEVPEITDQPESASVAAGQSVTFSVSATGTAPLSYRWQKNSSDVAGGSGSSLTISSATPAAAGNYRVIVSNGAGSVTSETAVLTVTDFNTPPVATIATPTEGTRYRAGQPVAFSGSATDTEDGSLPASSFSWRVDFHHDMHTHDGPPIASGTQSGTFTPPTSGETSDNVWYRLFLTVTDAGGLTSETYRDIYPFKSTIILATQPAGLKVTLDGQTVTTPRTAVSVEGIERLLGVVSPQTLGGVTYVFDRWLQGGPTTQTISTPQSDVTYTAVYKEASNALPSPWVTQDIGGVAAPGSAMFTSDVFTITGSGSDIWNRADEFRYVYQPLEGDGEIVARVRDLTNTNVWAKTGLMIRSSLADNAAHASVYVTSERGVALQWRTGAGNLTQHTGTPGQAPVWLRLIRKGDVVTAYQSATGSAWQTVGTTTVTLQGPAYIGMAVTSHNDGALNESGFDQVKVTQPQSFRPLELEAEDATIVGGQTATNHSGYTGTGFVDYRNPNNDFVEWQFSVPTAGAYQLTFRYALASGDRPLSVAVNGSTTVASLSFPASGGWSTWRTVTTNVALATGTNTVRLRATGSSGANVDHLRVNQGSAASLASPSVSAVRASAGAELSLFPNPATETVTLRFLGTTETGPVTVRVFGAALGQALLEVRTTAYPGENALNLEVNSLPTGVYLVQLQRGADRLTHQLIIRR